MSNLSEMVGRLTVKQRQWLFAGVLVASFTVGVGLLLILFTEPDRQDPRAKAKPDAARNVRTAVPGEPLDRRDVWLGAAGKDMADIKSRLEQKDKEISAVTGQVKETQVALERQKQLSQEMEAKLKTALDMKDQIASAAAKTFPDVGALQPNGSPPAPLRSNAPVTGMPPGAPPLAGGSSTPVELRGTGMIRVAVTDDSKRGSKDDGKPDNVDPPKSFLPIGFTRSTLIGGIAAPTGGQAQSNPLPVILRLDDDSVLPNRYRMDLKEAFVVGAAYGDISSERCMIRTETLGLVRKDGQAIEVPIKGVIYGEDGLLGLKGRLAEKQGRILANALLASVASGIGEGFRGSSVITSVSPLGSTESVKPGKEFAAGFGSGIGKAMDRLAQYYISLAERVHPVIECDAGRFADIAVTKGVSMDSVAGLVTERRVRSAKAASFYEADHEDD